MQSLNSLGVFVLDFVVARSEAFLKVRLLIVHTTHQIFIILLLLFDHLPQFLRLLLAFIDFVVRHVDRTQNVGLLLRLEGKCRLRLNDLRLSERSGSQMAANDALASVPEVVLLYLFR